jgi:hypothetical protein
MNLNSHAKRWLPIILLASVAMYFLTNRALTADSALPAIKSFVASNAEIEKQVGKVTEVTPGKRVSVSATANEAAYRLYTVSVRGTSKTAVMIIRVEGNEGDGPATLQSVVP